MERSTRFVMVWTVWMSVGALLVAATVRLVTQSWTWTVLALLVCGPVLSAIGRSARQPARPSRRARHDLGPSGGDRR